MKEGRLLDVKNYNPNKSLDSTLPPYQETSSFGKYFISNILVCQRYYRQSMVQKYYRKISLVVISENGQQNSKGQRLL